MKTKKTEVIEIPEAFPEEAGEGVLCYAGIHGETDADSMADRKNRVERYKEVVNYRECIPCDRCTYCIELRGFSNGGKEKLIGYVCTTMECETSSVNTCDRGLKNRSGRKKVLYDTTNAPLGFREGLATKTVKAELPPKTGREKNGVEVGVPQEGYVGGSNYYKRADGDREAIGSGKVPKGLMN